MKLKPVTTALFLLFSGAAFAGTTSTTQTQLDSMQAELNHMQQLINQNGGGTTSMGGTSLQQTLATSSDWSNAISISGLANVDMIFSNRTPVANNGVVALQPATGSTATNTAYGYNSSSNIQLSNADVFVDAQINDWTKAHFGFDYNSNISSPSQIIGDTASTSGLGVDEAYVTIGNFTENPFYFRAGKQYVNFGNYDRFAAVPTFTQLLTETNATAATVGFVSNGFYGSFYGFRGAANASSPTTVNVNNFGANVGLSNQSTAMGYNLGVGYLNNMSDVSYVATSTGFSNASKVAGVSADATMNMGMFDAGMHFVTAANSFGNITTSTDSGLTTTTAKPKALVVGGGVSFPVMNHASRFGVDYQHSWQAENVGLYGLPQQRYEGTYNVEWSKNVNVGLDLFTDRDYSVTNNGSGAAVTTGLVRLGVMFA